MKLEEAIEIQTDFAFNHRSIDALSLEEAAKLGIEAMEHIQRERKAGLYDFDDLLPGETKGGDNEQGNQGN